jgi:hypothetical protein|eukprot:COSAG01_NODE_584_length_15174_cov_27.387901_16_plen_92_part_00
MLLFLHRATSAVPFEGETSYHHDYVAHELDTSRMIPPRANVPLTMTVEAPRPTGFSASTTSGSAFQGWKLAEVREYVPGVQSVDVSDTQTL